ncbi:unnamed protein product [Caretta caretta]
MGIPLSLDLHFESILSLRDGNLEIQSTGQEFGDRGRTLGDHRRGLLPPNVHLAPTGEFTWDLWQQEAPKGTDECLSAESTMAEWA